jgi:nitrite reductase/ring-hydroxylating ferredoxin subunit
MADVLRFFHPVAPARRLEPAPSPRRGPAGRLLGRSASRPLKVVVDGRSWALFRDDRGHAAAVVDRCPHRFAPLSAGRVGPDGRLQCAYHGWSFDGAGRGRSPTQPSLQRCDVEAGRVIEQHGTIWLASGSVAGSSLPSLGVPEGHRLAGTFEMLFPAPLHVALDNFSEDEHTPWVHTRLGWHERDVATVDFRADNFPDRTEVSYTARQRDTALGPFIGLKRGDLFHNDWTTYFDPVRTLYSIYWTDPETGARRPGSLHAAIFMVPETERTTRFHVLLFTRFDGLLGKTGPLLDKLTVGLVWLEIRDDRLFVPTVADTPLDMKGMRLGRFDKPLIHNRKLLRGIYRGEADAEAREAPTE